MASPSTSRFRWSGPILVALSLLALGHGGRLAAQSHKVPSERLERLAARAMPAVVLIDVTTPTTTRQGSGFIVDPSGRILTNHHVISDATSARVKLASGDVYQNVEILADDPRLDLAVLQIRGFGLPSLPLGNSDSVQVGTPVVLIGSPLGLENTVSTGIVSGRRQEPEGYHLLQVSAAASPGSSGGAVLDSGGRVVGIAVSQMEGGQNLNFAVPIDYARGLLNHLGPKPLAVLRPRDEASSDSEAPPPPRPNTVNQGLFYRLGDFHGYRLDTQTDLGHGRVRRTRVTYRLIRAIGTSQVQIQRYRQSETTRVTQPFGTVQTLRRERSRVLVEADGLRPISARGETSWWNGSGWVTAQHDIRFQGLRALGTITDTAGRKVEVDQRLPAGIILRDMGNLAFALLDADTLVGRSAEFVTFDPSTGRTGYERYDVRGTTTIDVAGSRYHALRVNVADGLANETLFTRAAAPRVFLRRISDDGLRIEKVVSLRFYADSGSAGTAGAGPTKPGGNGGSPES